MEVMIALGVIAVLLTTLLTLQSTVFQRVIVSTLKIDRFYRIRNMFFLTRITPPDSEKKSWEKSLDDPAMILKYQKGPIKKGSQLERFTGLVQEQASGHWHEWATEREHTLIAYQFEPPRKEKKDASA